MNVRCRRFAPKLAALVFATALAASGGASALERMPKMVQVGTASWYGPGFHGRATASGERFDQNKLSAAHRTLPLNTPIRVTNLENGRSVALVVNDRGPYVPGRVLDVSKAAARELGMVQDGIVRVRIEPLTETSAMKPSAGGETMRVAGGPG